MHPSGVLGAIDGAQKSALGRCWGNAGGTQCDYGATGVAVFGAAGVYDLGYETLEHHQAVQWLQWLW